MKKVKWLILGAGPSGLTFANCLLDVGETNFVVLEAEAEAGGLCRSVQVDDIPLDIGGGHFLDVRRPKVCQFLFRFMAESEWLLYNRDSRIALGDLLVGHPLEANIWQFPQEMQVEYLKSIAVAGCNIGKPMPEKFVDWIYWKLGEKIANDYMLPYNKKMFGDDLDVLGTYWLEKLPNVSFDETLFSCLNRRPYGVQPGHAQFYYPKEYGYGEVWLRMAASIKEYVRYNAKVICLDVRNRVVAAVSGDEYQAEYVISTIPWDSFEMTGSGQMELIGEIGKLKHTGVEIEYFPENQESDAQWIYIPDSKLPYHRILSRKAFCPNGKGYWTETNLTRVSKKDKECIYRNEYAYPLNTLDKPGIMKRLLTTMQKERIYGLGRWGEHEHYNSDVVVERAIYMAEKLIEADK